MNKLKIRFMLVVIEFIIDMHERYKVELGVDNKKVKRYKELRDDLETELEEE